MNAVGWMPAGRSVARLARTAAGLGLALTLTACQGLSSHLSEGRLPPVAAEDRALLTWTWPYEMGRLDWARVRRARQAVERGDYAGGLARLEEMAADGLPPAHYELAKMYHYGHGVSRNLRRAEGLYRAAIRVNSSIRDNASYNLARLYLTHDELGNHDVLAFRLLEQALPGQRRAEALVQMAALRAGGGRGIPANHKVAEELYREAVRLGSDEALLALAEAYHDGGFLPADAEASRDYLARYRALLNARIAEGEVEAMLDMARLYGPEALLGPAPERRLAWLVRAAESGHADGMRRAGELIFVEDPARGFDWLRRAAHRGSVPAMATVGAIRLGAPAALADPVQARFWLEKAVDQRSTSAMMDLGEALLVGDALDPDPARGRALLEAAAQQGEPRALTLLGRAFMHGTGVPQRPRLALGYLQRAHRQGDVWGTIELGRLRLTGAGDLSPRPAEGEALLVSAAERGEAAAMRELAEAYLAGAALPARPSRAEALLQRAVALGDTTAMARLADAYLNGELGGAGPERALDLLATAAERGDDYAMLLLGRAYRQAPGGLNVDLVASERWLRRAVEAGHPSAPRALRNTLYAQGLAGSVPALIEAAEGGHPGAMEALGERYLTGEGVAVRPALAEQWLIEAAAAGRSGAALSLGRAYLDGGVLARHAERARRYLVPLAAAGEPNAVLVLGRAYLPGGGFEQDLDAAERYLAPLADRGHAVAARELGQTLVESAEPFRDVARGRQYLEQAVEAGDLYAQGALGRMLLRGDSGLVPEVERAHRLLRAAADAGHLGSLSVLGREYLAGDVLPFRPEQGARYLVRAVRRGHEEARFSLVSAYLRANGLVDRYAGRREARLWLDGVIQADDALALEVLYQLLAERPPEPTPRRED